jgi:hypothetical protein
MLRCVVIGVMVCGSAALADCPGHVATLPGVELARSEPFFANVYRQTPEGLTEARVMTRGGVAEEVSTIYAHPLAAARQVSAKGELVLDYAADPAELDQLDKTGRWSSSVTLKVDGRVVLTGEAEKRLAGVGTVTVGGCTTEVWLIEDRLALGQGDGSYLLLSYAPALGLVVRSVTMSAKGEPLQGVEFDRIEALAD